MNSVTFGEKPKRQKEWNVHSKPVQSQRAVKQVLADAERLRIELPQIVQVRFCDWDKVILADEHYALLKKVERLQKVLNGICPKCGDKLLWAEDRGVHCDNPECDWDIGNESETEADHE